MTLEKRIDSISTQSIQLRHGINLILRAKLRFLSTFPKTSHSKLATLSHLHEKSQKI